MKRSKKESMRLTVRALCHRLHGQKVAEPGMPLLLMLDNSDLGELYSRQGFVNSWAFLHNDGRRFYFKGIPAFGYVEVRRTTRGVVKYILKTSHDSLSFVRVEGLA